MLPTVPKPGKMVAMALHPRAGLPAQTSDLVDMSALITSYYTQHPDPQNPAQQVAFGTSGHRGSALSRSFNDDHIAATTQAVCEYRKSAGIQGPLFLGRDTHGLSLPAWSTTLEVLAAHGVTVLIDQREAWTPTPAISHAICRHNAGRSVDDHGRADGIVITPSHNPPRDGGFKYNPPHGGPADTATTLAIQTRANELISAGLDGLRRITLPRAMAAATTQRYDFLDHYVTDLVHVVNMEAIRSAGVRIGIDPLGGASVDYWAAIGERYALDLTVVNPRVDPAWPFMSLDWDGQIRMDCSSPWAMAPVIEQRDSFDIATGNDADADRHGIVTPHSGLMNPNHFLAVAIDYLFTHREQWPANAAIGKTMVSSSMINRVAGAMDRDVWEVPVGFKWFVPGLLNGSVGFGGEESAGASFLRQDGSVWTTDKDGLIMSLLAAEIMGVTGQDPGLRYDHLTERFGAPAYTRIDAPATREQKQRLSALSAAQITISDLAGEPITEILTHAPGNGAALGGVKVGTASSWFAARPSGTEDVYKIYAESFLGEDHLHQVQEVARTVVDAALGDAS